MQPGGLVQVVHKAFQAQRSLVLPMLPKCALCSEIRVRQEAEVALNFQTSNGMDLIITPLNVPSNKAHLECIKSKFGGMCINKEMREHQNKLNNHLRQY